MISKSKKIFTLAILLAVLAVTGLYWKFHSDKTIIENHYIPKGYEGIVTIFYQDSIKEDKIATSREYVIPTNGILKTKLPFTEEFVQMNFYSIGKSGEKTLIKLNVGQRIDSLSKEVQVFYMQSGVSETDDSKHQLTYLRYIVSTYKNLDSISQIFYKQRPSEMW